jgi:membrane protein
MGVGAKLGVPMKLVNTFTADLPEATRDVLTRTAQAFEQVDFRAVGAISILLIAFAAMRVLARIELAFNEIWGMKRGRPLLRKVLTYSAVIVFAPTLVFIALIATTTLLASGFVQEIRTYSATEATLEVIAPLLPWFGIWTALTLLYWLMPATKVRIVPAVVGAIVAGSVIQLVQRGVILAQAGLYQHGWVFGSLAVIPILLVWVYFTWIVVLYGAELSYGIQHAGSYLFLYEDEEDAPTVAETEEVAVRVALLFASAHAEKLAYDDEEIAERLGSAPRRVAGVLDTLTGARVFRRVGADQYRLAKSPDETTLEQVLRPFRGPIRRPVALRDEPRGAHTAIDRLVQHVREPLQLTLTEVLALGAGDEPAM